MRKAFPERLAGLSSPDLIRAQGALEAADEALFGRIAHRIDQGRVTLPHLPSTSATLLTLTAGSDADAATLALVIETDPVLSSELLREANSVALGARVPAETLQDGIVRVGQRRVRSLVLSLSMRSVILESGQLRNHATEAWRQAYSAGSIARSIAPFCRTDPERAFLFGLLQDIGKVALLNMLSQEHKDPKRITANLIGRLFNDYHEWAGRETARAWNLPDEIVAVAGCHHDYRANETAPTGAALARLAHKMDLFLARGAEDDFHALVECDELDALGIPVDQRFKLLEHGLEAYQKQIDAEQTAA